MKKERLTELDREHCTFILYTTSDERWIVDFFYSPSAYFDATMLIELAEEEKLLAQKDRKYLIEFAAKIQNDYRYFSPRELSQDQFVVGSRGST